MVSFRWPSVIPSGQRTYKTSSCLIKKTIKSIELEFDDGTIMDLFDENNDFNETDRLVFITGTIGVFCGVKNSLYAGYVVASGRNYIENFLYSGAYLTVKWNSEGKNDIIISLADLRNLVAILYETLWLSGYKVEFPQDNSLEITPEVLSSLLFPRAKETVNELGS